MAGAMPPALTERLAGNRSSTNENQLISPPKRQTDEVPSKPRPWREVVRRTTAELGFGLHLLVDGRGRAKGCFCAQYEKTRGNPRDQKQLRCPAMARLCKHITPIAEPIASCHRPDIPSLFR